MQVVSLERAQWKRALCRDAVDHHLPAAALQLEVFPGDPSGSPQPNLSPAKTRSLPEETKEKIIVASDTELSPRLLQVSRPLLYHACY